MKNSSDPFFILGRTNWRRGDLVEVRALDEILAALDDHGKLEGMLFMPEMAKYCGKRFRIARRADITCVEGFHPRRLRNTVFLEDLRCDGGSHDGCQRGCLMFWKTAWLKPVAEGEAAMPDARPGSSAVVAPTIAAHVPTTRDGRYYCQSTELADATIPISRWDPTAYFGGLFTSEATLAETARMIGRMVAVKVEQLLRNRVGQARTESPVATLKLRPGEWVEVRPRVEIESTLNQEGKNRGLSFEHEMFDHCGRRYQVAFPIEKIICEETGNMHQLRNTVVLEGVTCRGTCAKNCPRANHLYWREIWLKRTNGDSPAYEENRP